MKKISLVAFALLVIPVLNNCHSSNDFMITFDANGGYFNNDKTCTSKTIKVK